MQQQETELTSYLLGEITNKNSNDYLQTFYFTHKCVDGNDCVWYKSHAEYVVEHTTALWFKDDEIDWFEQDEQN